MRKIILCILMVLNFCLMATVIFAANEYTLIPIDLPGTTESYPRDINDEGVIVGFYNDGTKYHGFVYDHGTAEDIDFPGSAFTIAEGVNNSGHIVGAHFDTSSWHTNQHGFIYDGTSFTSFDYPGAVLTHPTAINNLGLIIGQYHNGDTWHGFIFNGTTFFPLDIHGYSSTQLLDINDLGQIVGLGNDTMVHGLVLNGGSRTFIDCPDSSYTDVGAIGNSGLISGTCRPEAINIGFVFDGVNFTYIEFPGVAAGGTHLEGINNNGHIVGYGAFSNASQPFLAIPSLSFITDKLQELVTDINTFDDVVFKSPKKKRVLIKKLNTVLKKINQELYEDAINKLRDAIIIRTDGCAESSSPDKTDWIVDCNSQEQIYSLIMDVIDILETLSDH